MTLDRAYPLGCQAPEHLLGQRERLPSPPLPSIRMAGRELELGACHPGRPSRCSVALGYYQSPFSGRGTGNRPPVGDAI